MRTSVMQLALVALLLCVHSVQTSVTNHTTTTTITVAPSTTVIAITAWNTPSSAPPIPHPHTSTMHPPTATTIGPPINTSRPMNTSYLTTGTTRGDQTTPAMTTDEDDKMGTGKGVVVGVDVGMNLTAKGYVKNWYKLLCDWMRGLWEKDGKGRRGVGGMGGKGEPWGMTGNVDNSLFNGAGRVLLVSLLLLLLGLCAHTLF